MCVSVCVCLSGLACEAGGCVCVSEWECVTCVTMCVFARAHCSCMYRCESTLSLGLACVLYVRVSACVGIHCLCLGIFWGVWCVCACMYGWVGVCVCVKALERQMVRDLIPNQGCVLGGLEGTGRTMAS